MPCQLDRTKCSLVIKRDWRFNNLQYAIVIIVFLLPIIALHYTPAEIVNDFLGQESFTVRLAALCLTVYLPFFISITAIVAHNKRYIAFINGEVRYHNGYKSKQIKLSENLTIIIMPSRFRIISVSGEVFDIYVSDWQFWPISTFYQYIDNN